MKGEITLVPVVEEFLAKWREAAHEHYETLYREYNEIRNTEYPINEANLKRIQVNSWTDKRQYSDEKIAAIMADLAIDPNTSWLANISRGNLESEIRYEYTVAFRKRIGKGDTAIIERMYEDGFLDKLLDREVATKRAKFFATVEKKAGNILDASSLYIGDDGSINGTVTGEIKTVTVTTIYAGGYNIQCLHYRVLVK